MSSKHIIIINGRQYDAKSGDLLPQANTSHKTATGKPAGRSHASRAAAHAPKPSRTLMRQAVKKPSPTHRQSVKAKGQLDALANRPINSVQVKPSVKHLDIERLQHAKLINKSQLVSRFSSDLFTSRQPVPPTHSAPVTAHALTPTPRSAARHRKPKTTAELLEYALRQATAHQQESPKAPRRSLFKRRARSAAA